MSTLQIERILQDPEKVCLLAEAFRGLSVVDVVTLHQAITTDRALWAHEMRQRDPLDGRVSFTEWRDERK